MMKTIAIIPAKSFSERCPEKNLRDFMGQPLFMHSVLYAQREGVEPVVSTDSEQVISLCEEKRIRYVREVVDDSTMCNCVRQVLAQVPCDLFAILQPSSPFRQPGLLRKMIRECTERHYGSAFTAHEIKPIGQLDGHFRLAFREQDSPNKFRFFDGNISLATRPFFGNTGELFDDSSVPFANSYPYTLQIDTEEDFTMLQHLATHADYRKLLPSPIRRVCVVSNRPYYARDYSAFVDSCDVVIRINKLESLVTELAGQKTDMAVVGCWHGYFYFSRAARHVDELLQVPRIFFDLESWELTHQFCESEGIHQWSFLPPYVESHSYCFSTFGKAVYLAHWLFPEAELFCLADPDVALRTGNSPKHIKSGETAFLSSLFDSDKLTCILEEDSALPQGRFSCELPAGKRDAMDKMRLFRAPATIPHSEVRIRHPRWSDSMRIVRNIACRTRRADFAKVLHFDDDSLSLEWECSSWGVENFTKDDSGVFVFTPQA